MELKFLPIQPKDLTTAFNFLMDSFKVSFGNDSKLWPNNLSQITEIKYFEILHKKLVTNPEFAVHIWHNNQIIGQIELNLKKEDNSCGYISLYYLIPEKRGLGLAKYLDEYAVKAFKDRKCNKAELTVDQANTSAILFYKKHGWQDLGAHSIYSGGLLMGKNI